MSGLIHCQPLEPPLNGILVYASEHGRIDSKAIHPMGTFVEVHCINGTVVKGEGFLSCIDIGIWDFPVPQCVHTTTTEASPVLITTTTTTTAATTTSSTTIATTTSTSTTTTTKKPVKSKIPPKIRKLKITVKVVWIFFS